MSSVPTISILLPAFDAEATLPACLESVVRQRELRWECIIVDDGSRDGTEAVARALAARDARIRLVTAPHRGLVATLNAGLEHCRGRVVARMDADDVMHRDRLGAELAALDADPVLAGVGCHVRMFPRAGLTAGLRDYERWLNAIDGAARVRAEAYVECPLAHPTLMIRTPILRALGYRDVGWPEDYDLVLRLLGAGHALGVVQRRLLAWRDRPGRQWRTDGRYALDRFTACKAAHLAAGLLAARDTYVLWGFGRTGRALRKALLAHDKRPSHLVEVHPGRIGKTIHGIPVISFPELQRAPCRPIVASVANEQARGEIRAALDAIGFRETEDYVCAA